MKSPRMRVKKEQKTSSQPWSLSQPRFMGMARAGSERRKVRNMTMALMTPAVRGHWKRRMSNATFCTFFAPRSCCSLTRQKPRRSPAAERNRKSTPRKVSMSLFMVTVVFTSKLPELREGMIFQRWTRKECNTSGAPASLAP